MKRIVIVAMGGLAAGAMLCAATAMAAEQLVTRVRGGSGLGISVGQGGVDLRAGGINLGVGQGDMARTTATSATSSNLITSGGRGGVSLSVGRGVGIGVGGGGVLLNAGGVGLRVGGVNGKAFSARGMPNGFGALKVR